VVPAAWPAAVNTGAGVLGLGSDEKALALKSRAACKGKALGETGGHRNSLGRGEGEWRPLLLKSTRGRGPWARLGKRIAV
jgi:hypothetical protein